MDVFQINLIIILSIALLSWLGFLILTRGIKTMVGGGGCDNDYMIRAASKSNEWKWPSDMHIKTYTGTSTSQKDLTILLLVLFQKIFRDKQGEFPIIALWSFANVASAFLIYLISSNYWNPNIGLLISLIYLVSFWPWQMCLFVGHLHVGTMFFLLAVYFTTLAISAGSIATYVWIFVSGISFCCMLFSSSSSLRYILPFFAAVFFAKHQVAAREISLNGFYQTIINNGSFVLILIFTIIFVLFLIFTKIFYKQIVSAIYNRKAWLLNGLITAKKYPLEYYLENTEKQLPNILRWLIKTFIFFFIILNLIGFDYFITIFLGYGTVFLILTLPNVKRSFGYYFRYFYISYMRPGINSDFVRYIKYGYFAKNNLKIPSNLRGGGWKWVPKLFFKMAPFHSLIYVAVIFLLIIVNYFSSKPILDLGSFVILILISLSPTLWAELTKAYQAAKPYFSGFIGFLVLIGYGAYIFQKYQYFWPITIGLISITLAWNLWKFFSDVYPARMSFNKIIKAFDKFKIKEIYTYDTFYNECFLDNVKTTPSLQNLKINFIKSMKEVGNGWILIPATTHKAGFFSQDENSIQKGDFNEDPLLNELLETKKIEKIASEKFQTTSGPGDIWVQECTIMSYFDLLLHRITPKDRFRGYAWLLHSSKLL